LGPVLVKVRVRFAVDVSTKITSAARRVEPASRANLA
jgi:hypothetical protein